MMINKIRLARPLVLSSLFLFVLLFEKRINEFQAATSVPVLCFLAGDERIRAALLGRMRKHYALLQPERAKRYNRA